MNNRTEHKTHKQDAGQETRKPKEPTLRGKQMREDVKSLHDEMSNRAKDHNIEVGPLTDFNLAFDVYDPETATVWTAARPHRRDTGEGAVLLTADGIVADIVASRRHQDLRGAEHYASDKIAAA